MLKIKNPQSHSLGLRRSCAPNRSPKPAMQESTAPWSTMMRQAFINTTVSLSTSAAIINSCAKAVQRGAGVLNLGKGWNASLSFKTAEKLKAEGVL